MIKFPAIHARDDPIRGVSALVMVTRKTDPKDVSNHDQIFLGMSRSCVNYSVNCIFKNKSCDDSKLLLCTDQHLRVCDDAADDQTTAVPLEI